MQNGLLEVTSRLLSIRKDELAHAIVSWRSRDYLTLLSAYKILKEAAPAFKKFFGQEVDLHLEMFASDRGHLLAAGSASEPMTPWRVRGMAIEAARGHATPCRFDSKRSNLD